MNRWANHPARWENLAQRFRSESPAETRLHQRVLPCQQHNDSVWILSSQALERSNRVLPTQQANKSKQ